MVVQSNNWFLLFLLEVRKHSVASKIVWVVILLIRCWDLIEALAPWLGSGPIKAFSQCFLGLFLVPNFVDFS